jgi:replicative DNA helicase
MAVSARNAEFAAVGTLLRGTDEAKEMILTELSASNFSSHQCAEAFAAAQKLMVQGFGINKSSMLDRAKVSSSDLEAMELAFSGSGPSHVRGVIADVRRAHTLRVFQSACESAAASVRKDSDPQQLMDALERELYRAADSGSASVKEGRMVMDTFMAKLLGRMNDTAPPPISTGLRDLDAYIVGLQSKLYIIAGRPAMGKTAITKTLRNSVIRQGWSVLDVSLEMSAEEHAEREVSERAGINLRKVITGKGMSPEEASRACGVPAMMPVDSWFIEDETYSVDAIIRKSRIVARKALQLGRPLKLVTIDYLQLATGGDDDTQRSLAKFSRGCKLLSRELDCAVVALSQLNRNCEYREDKRPLMADIRESGAIEQDADVIAFVYRDNVYNKSSPEDEGELIIRKQRSGPTGTVYLKWTGKTLSFSDSETQRPTSGEEE